MVALSPRAKAAYLPGMTNTHKFWETTPLQKMTPDEWEALCDGCGRCCLNKLEDIDTEELIFTRVACRLFDDTTCRCANYAQRKSIVPECVVLTPDNLHEIAYWMPETCAYRLLHEGKRLPDWHPLVTGDPTSTHKAGVSMQGRTVSEHAVPVEDWEDYPLDD
jgi:uncharacterized cysteine cluster protein YcgN (CxxCxxCC family)